LFHHICHPAGCQVRRIMKSTVPREKKPPIASLKTPNGRQSHRPRTHGQYQP